MKAKEQMLERVKKWKKTILYPPTPFFWEHMNVLAIALFPVAALYDFIVGLRNRAITVHRVKIPVICVGNCTLGGAGKTPLVHAIVDYLTSKGLKVGIISRGYGGTEAGPLKVDPNQHVAKQVGDEPLQLSRYHDVWIGKNRILCAHQAIKAGKDVVILDDGLQNPSIAKDLSLLTIDGGYGLGNALTFPSGPLREPLNDALRRVQAVVVIGEDKTNILPRLQGNKVIKASIVPDLSSVPPAGSSCVAFAGIGRPEKFFGMLSELGLKLIRTQAFPDHYPYEEEDLQALYDYATGQHAYLLTTEKDVQRVPPSLREGVTACRIRLVLEDTAIFDKLLSQLTLYNNPFKVE